MALRVDRPAFLPVVVALTFLFPFGACTLPTNVALKNADALRAAESDCLETNVKRLTASNAVPEAVARDAAASCRDRTEQLAAYAVPHVSPEERRAFEQDAVRRARSYAAQSRGAATR